MLLSKNVIVKVKQILLLLLFLSAFCCACRPLGGISRSNADSKSSVRLVSLCFVSLQDDSQSNIVCKILVTMIIINNQVTSRSLSLCLSLLIIRDSRSIVFTLGNALTRRRAAALQRPRGWRLLMAPARWDETKSDVFYCPLGDIFHGLRPAAVYVVAKWLSDNSSNIHIWHIYEEVSLWFSPWLSTRHSPRHSLWLSHRPNLWLSVWLSHQISHRPSHWLSLWLSPWLSRWLSYWPSLWLSLWLSP